MTSPIRTSLSPGEMRALMRLAEGKRVVEAGALLGASAWVLSHTAASVVSIDRHEGYGPSTLSTYHSNLWRFAAGRNIRPVVAEVLDALPTVAADFAFIDLTGEYALTRRALEVSSAGVVAVHDCCRVHCAGVERAIQDAGFVITGQVDTLVICERRYGT